MSTLGDLPQQVKLHRDTNGLERLRIESELADAEIYLHGAHVTHFQPSRQRAVLFMSRQSHFAPGKPIRGGVPVCFPWFGPRADDKNSPAHGFARLMPWTLVEARRENSGEIVVTLELRANEQTRATWNHDFVLQHHIRVGRWLEMTLRMRNTGSSPLKFEAALHSYFYVSDVRQVEVTGLENTNYLDKTRQMTLTAQANAPVRFIEETDRVYLDTTGMCVIHDPGWLHDIHVAKRNSSNTVVWNPWIEKARAMPDFGDNEWPDMVCVETCNVGKNAVELAPGATHEMTAVIHIA